MKLSLLVPAFALAFLVTILPASAGTVPATPGAGTGSTAAIDPALNPAAVPPAGTNPVVPASTVGTNTRPYTATTANRTGTIVGWVIGLAVLALIIGWAVSASRRRRVHGTTPAHPVNDPAHTVAPGNPNRTGNRPVHP